MTRWEKDRENVKTEKACGMLVAEKVFQLKILKETLLFASIILLDVVVQLKKILIHFWLH